jgi:hypothetical protein
VAIATLMRKVCTPIFKRILNGSLTFLTAARGLTIRNNEESRQLRRPHRGNNNR